MAPEHLPAQKEKWAGAGNGCLEENVFFELGNKHTRTTFKKHKWRYSRNDLHGDPHTAALRLWRGRCFPDAPAAFPWSPFTHLRYLTWLCIHLLVRLLFCTPTTLDMLLARAHGLLYKSQDWKVHRIHEIRVHVLCSMSTSLMSRLLSDLNKMSKFVG